MSELDLFLPNIGLTSAQLNNKKTYIGGSAAKDIADGKWTKVYNEMVTGEREDLSRVFKVQLGHITEYFNLVWFADMMDMQMNIDEISSRSQIAVRNPEHPYIGGLPDAIMTTPNGVEYVIDAKHSTCQAPWWDEQKVAEYYFPQMQHNMIATGVHKSYLSVIFGNEAPIAIEIKYDAAWCATYIALCTAFWSHIETKTTPHNPASIKIPKIALDDMRELDMRETNQASEWLEHCQCFIDNQAASKDFEDAKKALKKLVPDDVKYAHGDGVEITRNKAGAMTVRVK